VLSVFKTFKAWLELESEKKKKKIKFLIIDNAGKYTSDEFDNFCQQIGIKRQFTTTYTPQQNRVAEQMNKIHLEITRAMLKVAFLGKPYWPEVVKTICHVISQSPLTAIDLKTPIKMWIRKPLGYS